jgi:hypothetical protein
MQEPHISSMYLPHLTRSNADEHRAAFQVYRLERRAQSRPSSERANHQKRIVGRRSDTRHFRQNRGARDVALNFGYIIDFAWRLQDIRGVYPFLFP